MLPSELGFRQTYVEVDLEAIRKNIKSMQKVRPSKIKYFFAVVKVMLMVMEF